VSNVLSGATAAAITGLPTAFSIRPEKIRLANGSGGVPEGCCRVQGQIESVLYYGSSTRYNVALEGGGELTVIEQNRETRHEDAQQQGMPVLLWWERRHNQILGQPAERV
jgi:putative spermidine/putrescine transport system ATP-binding protein